MHIHIPHCILLSVSKMNEPDLSSRGRGDWREFRHLVLFTQVMQFSVTSFLVMQTRIQQGWNGLFHQRKLRSEKLCSVFRPCCGNQVSALCDKDTDCTGEIFHSLYIFRLLSSFSSLWQIHWLCSCCKIHWLGSRCTVFRLLSKWSFSSRQNQTASNLWQCINFVCIGEIFHSLACTVFRLLLCYHQNRASAIIGIGQQQSMTILWLFCLFEIFPLEVDERGEQKCQDTVWMLWAVHNCSSFLTYRVCTKSSTEFALIQIENLLQ